MSISKIPKKQLPESLRNPTRWKEVERTEAKGPIVFLDEELNSALWGVVNQSKPTNHYFLDRPADMEIQSLWLEPGTRSLFPSDLFFDGTIPVMDCVITIDERCAEDLEVRDVQTYRVVIFSDYQKYIAEAKPGQFIDVGAVIWGDCESSRKTYRKDFNMDPPELVGTIQVQVGDEACSFSRWTGYRNFPKHMRDHIRGNWEENIGKPIFAFMSTWYGIQLANMHPYVKDVFDNPSRTEYKSHTGSSKKNSRSKTRFIKKHVINADAVNLEEICRRRQIEFNRQTLLWYVRGHWRHPKDKPPIWVRGYQKGVDRNKGIDIKPKEIDITGYGDETTYVEEKEVSYA
jgi:hypothetical protein